MKNSAVRIAIMLGRQSASQALTIDEIAGDAISLAALGSRTRHALERQRDPGGFVVAARTIAERYGAMLIDQRDVEGAVMCLKFPSGLYSSGFRNLFFVA